MRRSSGILLPVFSLPSPYGVGNIHSAFSFIDFLSSAGVGCWQFLPLCPVGYGNSPYQAYSAFASEPLYISPELLVQEGLLTANELETAKISSERVDYEEAAARLYPLFRIAFSRSKTSDTAAFFKNNEEIYNYCLFIAIKESLGGLPLCDWPEPLRLRNDEAIKEAQAALADEILFHGFLQLCFKRQWDKLRAYAAQHNVRLIGDIPIYVSHDSADFWCNTQLFLTDEQGELTHIAGVPPDYFSETGQRWGNPLYDYAEMAKDGYSWWHKRVAFELSRCDVLRLDHFRGFADYWCIPADEESAFNGHWRNGPGMELIGSLTCRYGAERFIAEDLGFLSDKAWALLRESGLPGMKIMEFAFDGLCASDYQPHRYPKNCVAYTGTHDNDTVLGWFTAASEEVRRYAMDYLGADDSNIVWHMIRSLLASPADLVIVPIQDYLCEGSEYRINTPSTVGGNWSYRLEGKKLTDELSQRIRRLITLFER